MLACNEARQFFLPGTDAGEGMEEEKAEAAPNNPCDPREPKEAASDNDISDGEEPKGELNSGVDVGDENSDIVAANWANSLSLEEEEEWPLEEEWELSPDAATSRFIGTIEWSPRTTSVDR